MLSYILEYFNNSADTLISCFGYFQLAVWGTLCSPNCNLDLLNDLPAGNFVSDLLRKNCQFQPVLHLFKCSVSILGSGPLSEGFGQRRPSFYFFSFRQKVRDDHPSHFRNSGSVPHRRHQERVGVDRGRLHLPPDQLLPSGGFDRARRWRWLRHQPGCKLRQRVVSVSGA